MRVNIITLVTAAIVAGLAGVVQADELMHGCVIRPTCGKVCKLVCETKKLPGVGYGSKCESICIPAPGRRGCKHCEATCCPGDDLKGCPPVIEFCWYDWFACGCARPRTINVLTKYQAERKINTYHWEVVEASCCCVTQDGKQAADDSIYKPAPENAELGDILVVSDEEWDELAPMLEPSENPSESAGQVAKQAAPAPTTPEIKPDRISISERLQGLFHK